MKVKLVVSLKKTILDPQGRAIQQALRSIGYNQVNEVRMGKYLELELGDQTVESAKQQVTDMCEKLLANTVIEEYRFEINDR